MKYVEVQGEEIPALGLGTWQMEDRECEKAVRNALKTGYRHIDTAQAYGNEKQVGNAIKSSEVPRDDIWLTTKVWRSNFEHDDVISSVNQSLEKLQTHYVDLLLIHWPSREVPFEETLNAMEQLVDEEIVRNIGISNFTTSQMDEAQGSIGKPVLTNQVEYHPFIDQTEVLDKCREMEMMLTAYSPLARGDVMNNHTLREIADRHGKNPAQIALRWLIQQDSVSAIPKASNPEHQSQNFDIFDFELGPGEMREIDRLGGNRRKVDPGFAPNWD